MNENGKKIPQYWIKLISDPMFFFIFLSTFFWRGQNSSLIGNFLGTISQQTCCEKKTVNNIEYTLSQV